MAALILNSMAALLSWTYLSWSAMNTEFLQQTALAAPLSGAVATYYSGRLGAPSRVFANRAMSRPSTSIVGRDLGLLTATALATYLLCIAPALVATAITVEVGAFDARAFLTALLFIAVSVFFGYVVGLLGRSALLAPVTFVVLLGAAVGGGSEEYPLSPFPSEILDAGLLLEGPLLYYRLAVLSIMLVTCWHYAVELRQRTTRRPSAATGALLALAILGLLAPLLHKPAVFDYEANPPHVCRTAYDVEFCVHKGHSAQLGEVVAGGGLVLKNYGFTPDSLRHVYDSGLHGMTGLDERTTIWTPVQPTLPEDETAAGEVAIVLSGLGTCDFPNGNMSDSQFAQMQAVATLNDWLKSNSGRNGYGTVLYPGTSREAIQEWIRANSERLINCSVPAEEFPR